MAGAERVELPLTVLETVVLPLDEAPIKKMATRTGLEPVIFCVTGRRDNQLR